MISFEDLEIYECFAEGSIVDDAYAAPSDLWWRVEDIDLMLHSCTQHPEDTDSVWIDGLRELSEWKGRVYEMYLHGVRGGL